MYVVTLTYGRHTRQTGAGPLPVLAGCYAIVREVTSECLVSTAAPSETVAKQFLHLSNHSTVTATEGPAEEKERKGGRH